MASDGFDPLTPIPPLTGLRTGRAEWHIVPDPVSWYGVTLFWAVSESFSKYLHLLHLLHPPKLS